MRFMCIYLPPLPSPDSVKRLCNVISNLFTYNTPIYILGDFNLPDIDWSIPTSYGNVSHDLFLSFCNNNALQQLVTEPTHKGGNILDLLIGNMAAISLISSHSISAPLSLNCDHFLLSTELTLPGSSYCSKNSFFQDFSRVSYPEVCEALSAINWDSIYSINDCQEAYNYFFHTLTSSISNHIPVKVVRPHGKPPKPPPLIKKLLKEKHYAYKRSKTDRSWKEVFKEKSKQYDTAVNSWYDVREASMCANPSNKKFYNFVNKKLKSQQFIPPLLNQSGELLLEDPEKHHF